MQLFICLTPMPHSNNINYFRVVVYRINYTVMAYSYTPQVCKTLKFSATAWARFEA
ncbi:MAG TPA: hypothetical protein VK892_13990 [Pyrinomonadaceae bacterium]|nr:hypothetical protein [Pyrinomonadaceae bacterium]